MTLPGDDRDPRHEDASEIDRRFREIVEGLRGDPPGPPSPPPSSPAAPGDSEGPEPAPETTPPVVHRVTGPGTPPGMATDHRSYEPPELEDDDHFIPPPTPPLPAGDLHFWAIVIGLVGGTLLVLLSAVIPILRIQWAAVGVLLGLVGFVLLVLRLPRHRRDDDWGAQV